MLWGYLAFLLMGITLGSFGGGGAILTLPILVYLFGISPTLSTTYSLFIVGVAAFSSLIVNFFVIKPKSVILFLIPSLLGISVARHAVLKLLPGSFLILSWRVPKEFLLMMIFAAVLFVSAIMTLKAKEATKRREDSLLKLSILGFAVGILAGALGAGGGFLIVPALILFLGFSMKEAVPNSLAIIALQSLYGFSFSLLHSPDIDWQLLSNSSSAALVGMYLGRIVSSRIVEKQLKRYFAYFLLFMSLGIFLKELLSIFK